MCDRNNVGGRATVLRALRSGVQIQALLCYKTSRQRLIEWVPVFFPGSKVVGSRRDVDHSLPSSAVGKNKWNCTSTVSTCFLSVDRDDCTFLGF
jgi:hypothetical protein